MPTRRSTSPDPGKRKKPTPGKKQAAKRQPAAKPSAPAAPAKAPESKKRARSSGEEHGTPAPRSKGSKALKTAENAGDAGVGGSKPSARTKKPKAGVAQPAERRPSKSEVPGSTPGARSTKPPIDTATTVRKLLRATTPDPSAALAPDIEAFITEYLTNGLNGTAAYRTFKPHVAPATASSEAWKLLRKPEIRARVDAIRLGLAKRVEMTREQAIDHLQAIIEADPAEMMQMRRTSCPGCYGGAKVGTWTDPDLECEVCDGEGLERPWFADTRKLHPAVRQLFGGVKVTQQGIQLLMESKDSARGHLFKILGLYKQDNEQKSQPLAEAVRSFFSQIHGDRLPIAKAEPASGPAVPGHPLVGAS